eukprot:jgi/Undpi1/7291/HiC_scaffold_22.g09764.m1
MKQEQGKSQSLASLQAMRQFAVDTAGASASASARPKTTGSVRQLAIGGRRQSTGSIRAMMMQQRSNHPAAAGDNARSQQQPRLTRNLTHGDLRWVSSAPATAAFGARRGVGGRDGGTGASSSEVRAALGWQAGTTRLPGTGLAARRQSIDGGGVRLSSPEGQIGFLSRLPLLKAPHTGELLQQHQQRQHQHQHHRQHQHQQHHNHQQQQQEQRQRQQQRPEHNVLDSIETSLLSEHGISFGVSALRGRRPYMEDEYKVIPNLERAIGSGDTSGEEGQDVTPTHFFGVFDGHAGGRCSKALTKLLAQTVSREADFGLDLQSAVHKGFLRANAEFLLKAERFSANDGTISKCSEA